MSVFMICERALGLIRGKSLDELNTQARAMLENLDYEGLKRAFAQEEAVTCARHFAAVRDSLLKTYPWVFARKSVALAQLVSAVAGWRHAYTLPSDCLRLLDLVWRDKQVAKYEQAGEVVACEYSPVTARYTARVTDTDEWDALYQDAFCARLAGEMVPAVVGDFNIVALLTQQFQFAVHEAYRTGVIDACQGLEMDLYPYDGYSNDLSTEHLGSDFCGSWGYGS